MSLEIGQKIEILDIDLEVLFLIFQCDEREKIQFFKLIGISYFTFVNNPTMRFRLRLEAVETGKLFGAESECDCEG